MILDLFRKTQSWATKLILMLLAITFAFGFGFGVSNFGGSGRVPEGAAASVNGESIQLSDFYRARDALLRRYRRAGLTEDSINIDVIGIQALNQLVDVKLLSQEARRLGLRISDEELSESITTNPAFQAEGKFVGTDAYRRFVEGALNETVGEFERKYREELLASKMEDLINETAVIGDEELLSLYRMRRERVNLNYLRFSAEDFEGSYAPTDEEVKSYYGGHRGEFLAPELRTVEYFALDAGYFEGEVSVSDDEIRAYYEANRDEFVRKDEADSGAGETDRGGASEEGQDGGFIPLEEVAGDIRSTLEKRRASEYREGFLAGLESDLDSKSLHDLAEATGAGEPSLSAPFTAGESTAELPREVTSRAFDTGRGELSFVRVGDAVWLFEVREIIPPAPRNLEDVRDEIADRIAHEKAQEIAAQRAKEALEALRKGNKPLAEIATEFGAELNETGYFTRLGRISRVDSEDMKMDAFQLTEAEPVAPQVYSVDDSFYVALLQNKQPVDLDEFYSKKDQLREAEIRQRRQRIYVEWLRKLRGSAEITINQGLFSSAG